MFCFHPLLNHVAEKLSIVVLIYFQDLNKLYLGNLYFFLLPLRSTLSPFLVCSWLSLNILTIENISSEAYKIPHTHFLGIQAPNVTNTFGFLSFLNST